MKQQHTGSVSGFTLNQKRELQEAIVCAMQLCSRTFFVISLPNNNHLEGFLLLCLALNAILHPGLRGDLPIG